ncbi:hypothetical protein [Bradyrhizobium ottawaense]|uniref:hypothetical protein n=1 Tax=Bradyrhizobium ottawaense TaxID=931866 RepID=UPI0035168DE0
MASAFESHQKYKVTLYKKNKIPQHALRLAVFLRIFRDRATPGWQTLIADFHTVSDQADAISARDPLPKMFTGLGGF